MSPRLRTNSKKKISSGEALEIFRNWHTHNAGLWFFSLAMVDFVPNTEARVTLATPTRVELTGDGQTVSFDPRITDFWSLAASDVPFREVDVARFSRFLGMRNRETKDFSLLAELASVQ